MKDNFNSFNRGMAIPEGKFGKNGNDSSSSEFYNPVAGRNNTYKALRLITPEYNLYYSVWCTGDKEFYDVKVRYIPDPSSLLIRAHLANTVRPRPAQESPRFKTRCQLLFARRSRFSSSDSAPRRAPHGSQIMQGKRLSTPVEGAASARQRGDAARRAAFQV